MREPIKKSSVASLGPSRHYLIIYFNIFCNFVWQINKPENWSFAGGTSSHSLCAVISGRFSNSLHEQQKRKEPQNRRILLTIGADGQDGR